MVADKAEYLNEVFRLLDQQRELLKNWPYTKEQIRKDKEMSARLRKLVEQICVQQSAANAALATAQFEKARPLA